MSSRADFTPIFSAFLFVVAIFFAPLPASASLVTLSADIDSGVAPLEVKFTCRINTSETVFRYEMDYGDGSPLEIVESNQISHSFTHTYSDGLFNPLCSVVRNYGPVYSDPIKIVVAKWRFKTGADVDSSPAIGPDGTIFVGSDDGKIYAIDPVNGTELDHFKTGGRLQSSPSIDDNGIVYIGSEDGKVYAFRFQSGRFALKWAEPFNTGAPVFSTPAIGPDGTIYVGSGNGTLHAFHPEGSPKFGFPFQAGGKIASSPVIGHDGIQDIIYFGCLDKNVYAITADNGTLKWKFPTNAAVYGSSAIGSDGRIYVGELEIGSALEYNFNFYSINIDGTQNWNVNVGTGVYGSPAIGPNGVIYFGSWDRVFYALAPDGSRRWTVKKSFGINSTPAVGLADTVFFGSQDNNLYSHQPPSVDEDERTDWIFKTGDDIQSSPVIGPDGTVYFGSRDDHVYAINPGGMALADSAWPMFQGGIAHRGYNGNIQIPDVISTQPSESENNVDINTSEIRINFAPKIKKEQINAESFKFLKVVPDKDDEQLAGYAQPNSSNYNMSVLFYSYSEVLEYATDYKATINYTDAETSEVKTYSWTFTTQKVEEKDPDPDPEGEFCFIGTLRYPVSN